MGKTDIRINICGEELRVISDESEDYIKMVANYVENKATEPLKVSNSVNTATSIRLIYAAINITDEMFKIMEELNNTKLELANIKKEYEDFVNTFDTNLKKRENKSNNKKA